MVIFKILYAIAGAIYGILIWQEVKSDEKVDDIYTLYGTIMATIGISILWPIAVVGIWLLRAITWIKERG